MGTRLGAELRVTDDGADSRTPALVWTGSDHAITWEDTRGGGSDVYLALVDGSGTKTFGDALVWGGSGAPTAPAIGWSSTAGYLLTWEDFRDGGYKLHTGNVAADGAVIHTDERITNPSVGDSRASALAWSVNEYGIAWQDTRDGDQEIYFRRVDPSGYAIGLETRVTTASGGAEDAAIVWTGTGYALVWSDGRDGEPAIYFATLSEGGVLTAPAQRISEGGGAASAPSVAWTGGEHVVVWHDDRDGMQRIYLRRLDGSGKPLGEDARVGGEDGAARRPTLAWSGTALGLAWQDARGGEDAIFFASCQP
ncbi:MAG: hypothetical protein WKG00_15515 [Polyangiaceae bacterium]